MNENKALFVDLDGTLIKEDLSNLAFLHCLKKFPEEKQGRKNFKDKEIQNVKLLIYEKIIKKGTKIKADCVGNIKEKTMPKNITITVSYFKKHE